MGQDEDFRLSSPQLEVTMCSQLSVVGHDASQALLVPSSEQTRLLLACSQLGMGLPRGLWHSSELSHSGRSFVLIFGHFTFPSLSFPDPWLINFFYFILCRCFLQGYTEAEQKSHFLLVIPAPLFQQWRELRKSFYT